MMTRACFLSAAITATVARSPCCKILAVIPEAGEIDGDQRHHEAFAAASADDEPRFRGRRCRGLLPAGVLAVDGQLVFGHRQGE